MFSSSLNMSLANQINTEIARIHNVLDSVPFVDGSETKIPFLDSYKLSYANIKRLNITEESWEEYHQIPANKLLKLAISLGNLFESFKLEKSNIETRNARIKVNKRMQSSDPFTEGHSSTAKNNLIPVYYVNLTRNFALILKNFDVGVPESPNTLQRHLSSLSVYCKINVDEVITNGTGVTVDRQQRMGSFSNKSPIRLNSRQMLIEKLEINIRLDTMFTMKIVLKLLAELFLIIKQLWRDQDVEDEDELQPPIPASSASSVFSSASTSSEPLNVQEYTHLVHNILIRVNVGIIGPFISLLQTKAVEPHIYESFQNLLNTM